MKRLLLVLQLFSTVILATESNIAGTVHMDLSIDYDVSTPVPFNFNKGGNIRVEITNIVPRYLDHYRFDTAIITSTLDPFSTDVLKQQSTNFANNCDNKMQEVVEKLLSDNTEEKVRILLEEGNSYIADNCIVDTELSKKYLQLTLETKRTFIVYVAKGQDLVINVSRDDKKWKKVFHSVRQDRWLIHYGVAFAANRDKEYFVDSSGEQNVITQKRDKSNPKLLPSILFSYEHRSLCNGDGICFTPTAGIGTDSNTLAFLLGVSMIIGDNLILTLGASVYKAQQLLGEYHEGQILPEGSESIALQTEGYATAPFFSLGFRFSSDPNF